MHVLRKFEESGERVSRVTDCQVDDDEDDELNVRRERDNQQLSLLALLFTLFRKSSWVAASCKTTATEEKRDLSLWRLNGPLILNGRLMVSVGDFDKMGKIAGSTFDFTPVLVSAIVLDHLDLAGGLNESWRELKLTSTNCNKGGVNSVGSRK
ncbi:hypothetical protein L1887_05871 [Cichorium endivia]|nr:hypothetical protein L1887_05871 [Cichorium endivia]